MKSFVGKICMVRTYSAGVFAGMVEIIPMTGVAIASIGEVVVWKI